MENNKPAYEELERRIAALETQNAELRKILSVNDNTLESVRRVMPSAKRVARGIIDEAALRAESLAHEAQQRLSADIMLYEERIALKHQEYIDICAKVDAFRRSIFTQYTEHIESLENVHYLPLEEYPADEEYNTESIFGFEPRENDEEPLPWEAEPEAKPAEQPEPVQPVLADEPDTAPFTPEAPEAPQAPETPAAPEIPSAPETNEDLYRIFTEAIYDDAKKHVTPQTPQIASIPVEIIPEAPVAEPTQAAPEAPAPEKAPEETAAAAPDISDASGTPDAREADQPSAGNDLENAPLAQLGLNIERKPHEVTRPEKKLSDVMRQLEEINAKVRAVRR